MLVLVLEEFMRYEVKEEKDGQTHCVDGTVMHRAHFDA